jgi:hypothetical protein
MEREGRLDDPSYIERLADDDPLRRNENVFAFSLGCASLEISQFISMIAAPAGIADCGAQMYHLAQGSLDHDHRSCESNCLYSGALLGTGDTSGILVTARHPAAEAARALRRALGVEPIDRPSAAEQRPARWRHALARLRKVFRF